MTQRAIIIVKGQGRTQSTLTCEGSCSGHLQRLQPWIMWCATQVHLSPWGKDLYPSCREDFVASTQLSAMFGNCIFWRKPLAPLVVQPKHNDRLMQGCKILLSGSNTRQLWRTIPVLQLPAMLAKALWLPGNSSLCGYASVPFSIQALTLNALPNKC